MLKKFSYSIIFIYIFLKPNDVYGEFDIAEMVGFEEILLIPGIPKIKPDELAKV